MFNAELIIGPDIFAKISPEVWNELAERGNTNTPFQRHEYQSAWWKHLGEGDLLSLVVRDGENKLRGIACFNLRGDQLVFNATKEETDYLDLISSRKDTEGVWSAVFDGLYRENFPYWKTLDCYNIPAPSPTRAILPRLAESRGFIFREELAEVCPVIDLTDDFETYLANIDKKQRHEIRRKFRRAKGADARLNLIEDPGILHKSVDEFLDLLQKSTPEKSDWLNKGRIALFHDIADYALADGSLLLMFMEVSGEKISGLFNFCYGNRIWVYNSGIDVSRFSQLSLGVVVTSFAIKKGIEEGCKLFDFLRGNEEYKYRFGAYDTRIYRNIIEKPV